jgi:hypothetical protein
MPPKNNKNHKKSKGTSARKPPPPAAVEGKEAEEQDATSTPERPPSPRDSAGDACQSDSSLSDHSKQSSVESINIQAYERISVPQLLSRVMETIEDHPEFATYAVEAKELIDTSDAEQVNMGAKILQCLMLILDIIDNGTIPRGLTAALTTADVLRVIHNVPNKSPGYDPSLSDKQIQQLQTSKPQIPTRAELAQAFVDPKTGSSLLAEGTWNSKTQVCLEKVIDDMQTGVPVKNLLNSSFGGFLASNGTVPWAGASTSAFYKHTGGGGGGVGRFGGNILTSPKKTTGDVHSNMGSTSSVARKLASSQLTIKEKLVGFRRLPGERLDNDLYHAMDVLSKVSLGAVVSSEASVTTEVVIRAHRWHDAQVAIVSVVNELCNIVETLVPPEQCSWCPHLQQALAPGSELFTDLEASGMTAYLPGTLETLLSCTNDASPFAFSLVQGATSVNMFKEEMEGESGSGGANELQVLYSLTYEPEKGISNHFVRFQDSAAAAENILSPPPGSTASVHPSVSAEVVIQVAMMRLEGASRSRYSNRMTAQERSAVQKLVMKHRTGVLSSWPAIHKAVKKIQRKGLLLAQRSSNKNEPSHSAYVGQRASPSEEPADDDTSASLAAAAAMAAATSKHVSFQQSGGGGGDTKFQKPVTVADYCAALANFKDSALEANFDPADFLDPIDCKLLNGGYRLKPGGHGYATISIPNKIGAPYARTRWAIAILRNAITPPSPKYPNPQFNKEIYNAPLATKSSMRPTKSQRAAKKAAASAAELSATVAASAAVDGGAAMQALIDKAVQKALVQERAAPSKGQQAGSAAATQKADTNSRAVEDGFPEGYTFVDEHA